MSGQGRVPSGIPEGGQFTTVGRAESEVNLVDTLNASTDDYRALIEQYRASFVEDGIADHIAAAYAKVTVEEQMFPFGPDMHGYEPVGSDFCEGCDTYTKRWVGPNGLRQCQSCHAVDHKQERMRSARQFAVDPDSPTPPF